MPTRTLDVALWEYRDHYGRRRRAYYRETFELTDAEAERGERAQVFAPDEPGVRLSDTSQTEGVGGDGHPSSEVRKPLKTSTNPKLVRWLVEHRGADHDTIKDLNKADLWQLIDNPEN